MELYLIIKDIHVTTAVLSLLGFCLRSWWMLKESPLLQNKLVKILPHVNDTLLLSAAIYLALLSETYPFVVGWLGAKVLLLIGYILAGTITLKRGKTLKIRIISFFIAVGCIAGIFCLAFYRPIF